MSKLLEYLITLIILDGQFTECPKHILDGSSRKPIWPKPPSDSGKNGKEKGKRKKKESWTAVVFHHHYNPTLIFLYSFPFRSTNTNQIERCKCPLMRKMDDDFTLANEDA